MMLPLIYLPLVLQVFALGAAALPLLQLNFARSGLSSSLTLSQVQQDFINANITRDAHITFDPTVFLDVTFPGSILNGCTTTVLTNPGTVLTITDVAPAPSYSLGVESGTSVENVNTTYVVIAFDLDAPSPSNPFLSPFRHFLGGNFAPEISDSDTYNLTESVSPVTPWLSPNPLSVDPHRYVFLLYEQSPEFASQTLVTPFTSRIGWNVSAFAEEVGLGNPVGGNYMLVGLPEL